MEKEQEEQISIINSISEFIDKEYTPTHLFSEETLFSLEKISELVETAMGPVPRLLVKEALTASGYRIRQVGNKFYWLLEAKSSF